VSETGATAGAAATPGPLVLELALPPREARGLPHLLGDPARRRAVPLRLTWYDSPGHDLAAEGLALAERQHGRQRSWRLFRMGPAAGAVWLPGTPSPVLAEAAEAMALNAALPTPLASVVGFEGRARTLAAPEAVEVTLITGRLRAGTATRRCCRVRLAGPAGAVAALAGELAGPLHLHVPAASLAAEAMAFAGHPPRRRRAAPALLPDQPVGAAFAHLVARLTGTILHEAAHAGPAESEPVHQMRVAVRRLRSAVALFGKATHCPELAAGKTALQALAGVLAPARDWDVFAEGTGPAVAASFAEDAAVHRLLAAAERRRLAAYTALRRYLASAAFRRLGIALAALAAARPWEATERGQDAEAAARQAERLAGSLADFAGRALGRRLRTLGTATGDIEALPAEELHALRLHGKRLRYVAEFCAPLFAGRGSRRFIRRLTALQERLGHLNDGAVAAGLLADLGAAHSFAGGVVRGFVAARSAGERPRIGRAWRRFHRLDAFWT
jgi:CHAD domain-containing protein